jgi:hypothetical protein
MEKAGWPQSSASADRPAQFSRKARDLLSVRLKSKAKLITARPPNGSQNPASRTSPIAAPLSPA